MLGVGTLTADDVGARVIVRRSLGPRAGDPPYSDVLGNLLALDEDTVLVETRTGATVRVACREVVAAKRIPPRPVRATR